MKDAKKVPLSQGLFAYVDAEDYDRVMQYKWYASNAKRMDQKPLWYAQRTFYSKGKKKTVKLHRFILEPPDHLVVDHIDGNGLNNTRANLELVTFSENALRSNKKRQKIIEPFL